MGNSLISSKEVETDRSVIETELQHLLQHKRFSGSPQLSAFLRYIVTQTLDGNGDRIKAYSVGVDALGKPHSFDAQNDPSVRVLALRLRKVLKANYEDQDSHHAHIELKVGTYVPEFYRAVSSSGSDVEQDDPALASAGSSNTEAHTCSKGSEPHGMTLRLSPLLVCLVVMTVVGGWLLNGARDRGHVLEKAIDKSPLSMPMTASTAKVETPGKRLETLIPTLYISDSASHSRPLQRVAVLLGATVVKSGRINVVRVQGPHSSLISADNGYRMELDEILMDRHSRIVAQLIHQGTGIVVMNETLLLDLAINGFSDDELRWIEDLARDISDSAGPLFADFCSGGATPPITQCELSAESSLQG